LLRETEILIKLLLLFLEPGCSLGLDEAVHIILTVKPAKNYIFDVNFTVIV